MDDLCVHCGQPLVTVHYTSNTVAMATDRIMHRMGSRLCPDGSGRHACPAQSGYE